MGYNPWGRKESGTTERLLCVCVCIEVSLGFPDSSFGKESVCNAGDLVRFLGWEDPLEKGKATHSSILVWRISWTV